MNHPEREEWVPYIYGEAEPEVRQRLKQHLQSCSQCREQVEGWKQTLQRLNGWKLPKVQPLLTFEPFVRWAVPVAAMLVVMALGVGFGRLTAPKASTAELRAAMEPEIRQQLRQEFAEVLRDELTRTATATLAAADNRTRDLLAQYVSTAQAQRLQDNRAASAALDKLYVSLKRQLDTVAVNADASLRNTEEQLFHLAAYTPPTLPPNSTRQ